MLAAPAHTSLPVRAIYVKALYFYESLIYFYFYEELNNSFMAK